MSARTALLGAFQAMSLSECDRDLYFGRTSGPRRPYADDVHRTMYLHTTILGAAATVVAEVTIYDRTDYVIESAHLLDVAGVECSVEPGQIPLDPAKVERECSEELMRLVAEAWQS